MLWNLVLLMKLKNFIIGMVNVKAFPLGKVMLGQEGLKVVK